MAVFTLATLRTSFRTLGGYSNSRTITDALILEWLNKAIGAYCDLLDKTHEGYRDKTGTVATVAGTATAALPADFLKAKAVDILLSGEYVPLRRFSIRQTYGFTDRGEPVGYLTVGANLELFPTPDAIYTLRLRYVPTATVLALDADSITVPNGWEGFILESALLNADKKQERPLGDRKASIAEERQRIVDAAEGRNQAEPEYLVPHGDFGDWL